jgi:hypothetical protein
LGADLLGDPQDIWLSGQAVSYLESQSTPLAAQPGVEKALSVSGQSPAYGSCLLYGDSGLPTQTGPLAPDKIVFRSGWSESDIYLLLNLRFTGWHRYKATNTVTLLYQQGALLTDQVKGQSFAWLPTGRSQFRDKRVPRENLNGLVVERTGLDAVLFTLTAVGGPWAQDPPAYATVAQFETHADKDLSRTVLENWHGWTQTRTITFYHSGVVVVEDEAIGPVGSLAALAWQAPVPVGQQRFILRSGANPVEWVILSEPASDVPVDGLPRTPSGLVAATTSGQLRSVSVFLFSAWQGAAVRQNRAASGLVLEIIGSGAHLEVPLGEGVR